MRVNCAGVRGAPSWRLLGTQGARSCGAQGTTAWVPVEETDRIPERPADPADDGGGCVLVKRRGSRGSGRRLRQRGEAPRPLRPGPRPRPSRADWVPASQARPCTVLSPTSAWQTGPLFPGPPGLRGGDQGWAGPGHAGCRLPRATPGDQGDHRVCLRRVRPGSDSCLLAVLGGPPGEARGLRDSHALSRYLHPASLSPQTLPLLRHQGECRPCEGNCGPGLRPAGAGCPPPPRAVPGTGQLANGWLSLRPTRPASPAIQETPWSLWAPGPRSCSEQTLVL